MKHGRVLRATDRERGLIERGRGEQSPPAQQPEGDPVEVSGRIGASPDAPPVPKGAGERLLRDIFRSRSGAAGQNERPDEARVVQAEEFDEVVRLRERQDGVRR